MRRFGLFVVVAVLVAIALPATARRVANESHNELQIQANMSSDDGSEQGGAWAIRGTNGEAIGIDFDAWYECPVENTDFAAVSIHGEAYFEVPGDFLVTPTKGKTKFTTGEATGRFSEGSYDWEKCNGDSGHTNLYFENIFITMDGADGSLVKTSGSNSWHIPSEQNQHRNDKGTLRQAWGQVIIPGALDWEGEGSIGVHSWSEHTNEK